MISGTILVSSIVRLDMAGWYKYYVILKSVCKLGGILLLLGSTILGNMCFQGKNVRIENIFGTKLGIFYKCF